MELLHIDINNVCRTCNRESTEMKSLYYSESESGKENPRLDEMLMACASVQVSNEDGLPKSICQSCFVQLKLAYSFKELCEKTDSFLRDYVKSIKKEGCIKEEQQITDFEFISNLLSDINNDQPLEQAIKDDPECQPIPGHEKDMNYIKEIDNNVTIHECRTCSEVFCTLEGLKSHKCLRTGHTFKCKQCDKSYRKLNYLNRHKLSHSKRKMYVCKICNKTLTRLQHIKRHLITHLKKKLFGCPTCNREFNRVEHLQKHMKCCKGERVYICDICNKGFNREDSLEVHKKLHENKMPKFDNLDNAEQYYLEIDFDDGKVLDFLDDGQSDADDRMDLADEAMIESEVEVSENRDPDKIDEIAHMANEIYSEEDSPEMIEEKAKIQQAIFKDNEEVVEMDEHGADMDNGNNNYESDNSVHSEYLPTKQISPKVKKRRSRPRKHPLSGCKSTGRPRGLLPMIKNKTEIVEAEEGTETKIHSYSECHQVFTKKSLLEKHADKHHLGAKIHECDTCKKKFNQANSLKRHKLLHVEVKPFLCLTCQKSFSRRDHLEKHMKLHLTSGSENHTCELCQAVFHNPENLIKHKTNKHNKGKKVLSFEKKYTGQYCQKNFTTEKNQDSHIKANFDENKFQCKTCSKTFISKSHLTEHVKIHNDSSKKFLCSECGQGFIRNDSLVVHMRRHRGEKPFKCKFCGKRFFRMTDLTVHERYHTGEKTHLCVICGRGFGRAYNLTLHMRTHTGEKPYHCTYCEAAFAQSSDLKTHVRRHTGERFQCDLCPEAFVVGYQLTHHKRIVHGLNVVSNIRRFQPSNKLNPDDPPPITIPLPTPAVVPSAVAIDPLHIELSELKQE